MRVTVKPTSAAEFYLKYLGGNRKMKRALVLVDIQKDYFPGGKKPLPGMEEASRKASKLLSYFRETGQSVFHIHHIATRPGSAFFIQDTDGAKVHPSVAPKADEEVITKAHPNSFLNTALLDLLRAGRHDEVVICGAMSNMCIDATTRAAADFGFKCTVIHDACAASDLIFAERKVPAPDVHAAFMAALSAAYARVVTLDEFVMNADRKA